MLFFTPESKITLADLPDRDKIKLASMTFTENGNTVMKSGNEILFTTLNPDTIYLITVIDDYTVQRLLELINFNFKTDFNKISKPGYHIVNFKQDFKPSDINKTIPQLCVDEIRNIDTNEKWCKNSVPWNNTLKEVKADSYYVIKVSEVRGSFIEIDQEEAGVKFVKNGIQGVCLESGDFTFGVRFLTDDQDIKLKIYPLSVGINPLDMMEAKVSVFGANVAVMYNKEYVGASISFEKNGVFIYAILTKSGIDVTTPVDIVSAKLFFKQRETNNIYNKETMVVYALDTVFLIHFSKDYLGDSFTLSFKDKIFNSQFDNHYSWLDTPKILIESRS